MPHFNGTKFRKGVYVVANEAGVTARVASGKVRLWRIVAATPCQNPSHPWIYDVHPHHPFGRVNGMFFRVALACEVAVAKKAGEI